MNAKLLKRFLTLKFLIEYLKNDVRDRFIRLFSEDSFQLQSDLPFTTVYVRQNPNVHFLSNFQLEMRFSALMKAPIFGHKISNRAYPSRIGALMKNSQNFEILKTLLDQI